MLFMYVLSVCIIFVLFVINRYFLYRFASESDFKCCPTCPNLNLATKGCVAFTDYAIAL